MLIVAPHLPVIARSLQKDGQVPDCILTAADKERLKEILMRHRDNISNYGHWGRIARKPQAGLKSFAKKIK
ncbi:hypothetical protein [Arcticibacter tournemirensis]|uniref:hypothetical protein n=1 Tax=Arcticibacter tournemirensis TaxID=699437 RepID=UPI001386715E|nr:hypothetical protein [Arcticibacter tournemirensis]